MNIYILMLSINKVIKMSELRPRNIQGRGSHYHWINFKINHLIIIIKMASSTSTDYY